ncbi:MAG: hypothetical protein GXY58_02480 [Planctomycetaceae bacterium]|nr:hypothetical protein [Planctomycetaceae bacterium]
MNVGLSERVPDAAGGTNRRPARIMAMVALLWATAAVAVWPAAVRGQDSWEYTPYQIRVWLSVRPSATLSALWQQRLVDTLEVLAPIHGGATWRLTAEVAPETIGASMAVAFDELDVDQVRAAQPEALTHDKLMLLCVQETHGRFTLACRELDCRTRTFGETVRRDMWQRELVARVVADLVAESFRPLVRLESARGKKATVRIRGGGLVQDASCPAAVSAGDVLQPVVRRNDRTGEPRPQGIQIIDWTYLLVRDAQEYLLNCDVYSALRNPLGGRSSTSIERLALKVRPLGSRTTLQLVDRDQPAVPLEGYEMFAKKPVADTDAEPNPSVRLGVTDWRGTIDVEQSELPLRVIYVKNGAHLLARIPIVPGYRPFEQVPLPNDDKRLEAEAFVKGMERTVMDLVARREILSVRIRRRVAEGKRDEAQTLLNELKSLQTKDDLEMMLASRQAALASPDRRQQQRIDQLLSGTRSLLHKYLSPELLVVLEREISSANY